MVDLKNVTLVSITSVKVDRAVKALRYSTRGINFNEVLLLTDKDVVEENIKVEKIGTLDYIGYSKFIVYELHNYIKTDFALIIQDDGFVINPNKWSDVFLEYD